jgi:cbb3-type cytochrome oxidase maturation protein
MGALIMLLPISLALGLLGLLGFLWALSTRQYEDLDGADTRIATSASSATYWAK